MPVCNVHPPSEDKRGTGRWQAMSDPTDTVPHVPKVRSILACSACRQQVSQWVGRCPGCGQWGTIDEVRAAGGASSRAGRAAALSTLASAPDDERRVSTGFAGIDRVLGGGIVPASVALLAGEPGIGKSTLLLHVLAHLSAAGRGVRVGVG